MFYYENKIINYKTETHNQLTNIITVDIVKRITAKVKNHYVKRKKF